MDCVNDEIVMPCYEHVKHKIMIQYVNTLTMATLEMIDNNIKIAISSARPRSPSIILVVRHTEVSRLWSIHLFVTQKGGSVTWLEINDA